MRIALGIPILGMLHGVPAYSHMGLAAEIAHEADLYIPEVLNYTPYDRGRNVACDKAIRHDCDFMFFADSDNVIPAGAFGSMMRMLQAEDAVMVSGYYCRRKAPWGTVWVTAGADDAGMPADGSPVDLVGSGLGCALIDLRWVQDHLTEPYFFMPDNGGTEDYPFCQRVLAEGGRIVGHSGVIAGHMPELVPVTPANTKQYTDLVVRHAEHPCMEIRELEMSHGTA